jgi:hypothetical protein
MATFIEASEHYIVNLDCITKVRNDAGGDIRVFFITGGDEEKTSILLKGNDASRFLATLKGHNAAL